MLRVFLLAYLGVVLLFYFGQAWLVFRPDADREYRVDPGHFGLEFSTVRLTTSDGEMLLGWHVPPPKEQEARGIVILFPGNAGNIGHRIAYIQMFRSLGLATLAIDYRGYGRSSGSPSEAGTYRDADAAWTFARRTLGFPTQRTILFGESLGGGVATALAAAQRPGALVLASTFTSVPDLGAEYYPLLPIRALARIQYDNLALIRNVETPVLVIHSRDDEIIPFTHGERLYAAARTPKRMIEIAGGHNEGFVFDRDQWVRAMDNFLVQVAGIPPQ